MEFWLGASFCRTGQFVEIARAADRLGYHAVTLSDHLFYQPRFSSRYPYTADGEPAWDGATHWPDVWVTVGAMAAVTERVRFASNVYIAPARDLFTVAKTVSTAAVLSGDRVTLGVGAGWCADEFAQTGQDFHTRGRRLDEMIPALRELWTGALVERHGAHLDFGPASISPAPGRPVPVYVGGDSDAALRRAARLGDGWIGNRVYRIDELTEVVDRIGGHLRDRGRTAGDLGIVAAVAARPDAGLYRDLEERGVTGVMCAPWWMGRPAAPRRAAYADAATHDADLAEKIAAMERFAEAVIARV
ncbi:MAG TPA: TIGR03619 family F420-dependent LLM class oxidoreductase [Streptosporangiaceae bacterium]|jgi:probable F420-dependent oxidoreductase